MKTYEISDGIASEEFQFPNNTVAAKNISKWFEGADWSDWRNGSLILLSVHDSENNEIANQWFKYDKDRDQWLATTETE